MRLKPGTEDAVLYADIFSMNWWGEDVHFFFDQTLRVWRMVGGAHDFLIKEGIFVLIQGSPQGDALLMVHEPRQRYDEDDSRYPIRSLIMARSDGTVQVLLRARLKPSRVFWSDDGQHVAVLIHERYNEDFEPQQRYLLVGSTGDEEIMLPANGIDQIAEIILSPEGQLVAYRVAQGPKSVLRDANHHQLVTGRGITRLEYGEVSGKRFVRYQQQSRDGDEAFASLVFL